MNTIRQHGFEIKKTIFPDGQPHVQFVGNMQRGDEVRLVWSITDSKELLMLLQVSEALESLGAKKKVLDIPYLMGARFDRRMQEGDSFDLKIVADLVNMCGFEQVNLFDAHSDVATALIKNSVNRAPDFLVDSYHRQKAVLICPDAGAVKKVPFYLRNKNIVDVVYCVKQRDLRNGHVTLKVIEPERCVGRNCVVIDDICDGGATFLAIADQIQPEHLTLIVSHGIFSKGLGKLAAKFNHIITSDSLPQAGHSKLTVVPLNI